MSIIDNLSEKQKEKILEITSHDAKEWNEFKVFRVKTVIEKEKRLVLYNGTKLKFSEVEPFVGDSPFHLAN